MVFDRHPSAGLYKGIDSRIARGIEYLQATDLTALPSGRNEVDGDRLFALVNDYTTSPLEKCRFESHRRYLDIQWMVRGDEQIGVTHVDTLEVVDPHDEQRDIAFYRGSGDRITLSAGTFAIFFPHDAHQPGICLTTPELVRKVVVKVEL